MVRPTTAAAAEAPEAVQLRRQALSPFLEQFREWSSQLQDPQAVPCFAEIAARSIDLGCWERSVLKQACADERPDRRALEMLGEGVAYQVRSLDLLGLFTHGPMPPPAELPQFLDRLVTDVAVGMALADELRWEVDDLISRGQLVHAKPLSEFRNKIVKCLDELKERVGATELEQAEQRAPTFLALERRPAPEWEPPQLEEDAEVPTWAAFGPGRPEPALPPQPKPRDSTPASTALPTADGRPRIKPLLYALAALTLLYGVITLSRPPEPQLAVLSLERFSHLPAVQRIKARPPSLFVTLHPDRWSELSAAERQELLAQIGRIASGVGYSGAHVRTDRGASVGQWMSKTGVRLLNHPAGGS